MPKNNNKIDVGTDIIVTIGGAELNITDVTRQITENPDIMRYIDHLLATYDAIDTSNPNNQYVLLGKQAILKELKKLKTKKPRK